jgi:formate hydrogenlyase subunit 7
VSSWIGQSARRGIVTSDYPKKTATDDELPATAKGPLSQRLGTMPATVVDACPVGAIGPESVDQGRCIRCARCLAHGFAFAGPAETARATLAELRSPAAGPSAARPAAAPLGTLGRSLHVFLVDVGSCNACNLEVLALSNPYYDLSRLGVFFTNSPRHADVLLVVGVPTEEMLEPLRRAYEALPSPKAVVAVGACAVSGGAFRGNPGLHGGLDGLVPVDLWVPGCPPAPIQLLDALLALVGRARG